MTGSAVPVLNVWTKKKISIKGEGFGERGYNCQPWPEGGGGFSCFQYFLTGVHGLTC